MIEVLEKDVLDELKKRWLGNLDRIEQANGSSCGFPDLLLYVYGTENSYKMEIGKLVPVEAKRGWLREDRLRIDQIRPSQVSWHTRFALAKGNSFFLVGVQINDKLELFLAGAEYALASRKDGMLISKHCIWMPPEPKLFSERLKNFVFS